MVRAKKVFGQDSITVITQRWHNERAVFIAKHKELEAIGFNAKGVKIKQSYIKTHLREGLAKVKVVLNLLFHKEPKFLGDPVVVG